MGRAKSKDDLKVRLSLRVSPKRMNKFRAIAKFRDKEMTQILEDWIDTLPDPPEDSH